MSHPIQLAVSDDLQRTRLTVAFRIILAIPHFIVLAFLDLAAIIVVIIAWFAILFTGRYPRSLFDFVEGVIRWNNRVLGYAFVMATDQYPPFRLAP